MSIITNTSTIPADFLSDGEAVLEAIMAGRKPDPGLAERVRLRAGRISEEIHRKHGVLDIGTTAIRELRDQ